MKTNELDELHNYCENCKRVQDNQDVEPLYPHSDMNKGNSGEMNAPDDIAKLKQELEEAGGMLPNSQWNATPFVRETKDDNESDDLKLLPNLD